MHEQLEVALRAVLHALRLDIHDLQPVEFAGDELLAALRPVYLEVADGEQVEAEAVDLVGREWQRRELWLLLFGRALSKVCGPVPGRVFALVLCRVFTASLAVAIQNVADGVNQPVEEVARRVGGGRAAALGDGRRSAGA